MEFLFEHVTSQKLKINILVCKVNKPISDINSDILHCYHFKMVASVHTCILRLCYSKIETFKSANVLSARICWDHCHPVDDQKCRLTRCYH